MNKKRIDTIFRELANRMSADEFTEFVASQPSAQDIMDKLVSLKPKTASLNPYGFPERKGKITTDMLG